MCLNSHNFYKALVCLGSISLFIFLSQIIAETLGLPYVYCSCYQKHVGQFGLRSDQRLHKHRENIQMFYCLAVVLQIYCSLFRCLNLQFRMERMGQRLSPAASLEVLVSDNTQKRQFVCLHL